MKPYIKKILVGQARELGFPNAPDLMDRPWVTGIFKERVRGKIWLGQSGLEGDQVGDTKNHGGPEKAVFAYPVFHYEYWQTQPGLKTMTIGAMGENLSVENALEETVCIGDIFRFGEAVIQVSQPRQPCWRPARRFRVKDLALQIQETGRTGWYYRVLETGYVEAEAELVLLEQPAPQWTIALCNRVMHDRPENLELSAELAANRFLAVNWKRTLDQRLTGMTSSIEKRVFGPNQES